MHFHVGRFDDAEALIKRLHYSHRMTSNVQVVGTWHEDGGLFGDFGECVAACVFSIPPTRWSEDVWELSRLCRDERPLPPLTGLIAETVSFIRRAKTADLLVSFADWSFDHHGGVYQAASWNFAGKRDRSMDGAIIDGVFWPGRTLNSRYGTRSPEKLSALVSGVVEPHYDEGKFLYWRALSRTGQAKAVRLGLDKLPYPKPAERVAA